MFVLFKKIDTEVFVNTPSFSDLPRDPPANAKRKQTGRGAHKKAKKSRVDSLTQSTESEVDSPVKTLVIDMDAFTDDEQDYVLRNDLVEESGEGEGGESDTRVIMRVMYLKAMGEGTVMSSFFSDLYNL